MAKITESEVEEAAIGWLQELGYDYGYGPDITGEGGERDDHRQVVLADRLLGALKRINPGLPAVTMKKAVAILSAFDNPDLVESNRAFHRLVVDGVRVSYAAHGQQKDTIVQVVDFENPENNDWYVVNQFTVQGPKHTCRPDLVVFLNGLPLVVIELKNPADESADIWKAYDQMQNYKKDIRAVFHHNAFCLISDFSNARMGSLTANKERYMAWRTVDGVNLDPFGPGQELETLLRGVFQKGLLLRYLRNFILFEVEGTLVKKIAGYHQIHAVLALAESVVCAAAPGGNRKGGVVWHTQGAGKSIEMVCSGSVLLTEPALKNPTLVIVTDRNDLDGQLFETFSRNAELLREAPIQAESRDELRKLLNGRPSGGVIFTTVQKFALEAGEEKFPQLTTRENVVVICDEAHRSQYGLTAQLSQKDGAIRYGHAKHMRDALPSATFVAFTGTPVSSTDRDTRAVFGDYVHIYDIEQAVKDGATVPVYYESRLVKLDLKPEETPHIDEQVEELAEDEEELETSARYRKWAALEKIVAAQPRVAKVAKDLVGHFGARAQVEFGKAMVVAMSREACVRLYDEIVKLRPHWHDDDPSTGAIKIVMTGSSSDKPHIREHVYSKDTRKLLEKRFKDEADPLQLVIVRDMWLTGFDAPVVNALYVDKPMKGHNLMQAIARANRVFKDKPGGLVVDYIGIAGELKLALKEYTASKGKGRPTVDAAEAFAKFLDEMDILRGLLHGCDYLEFRAKALSVLPKAVDHILKQTHKEKAKEGRRLFADHTVAAGKAFALSCTLDEAAPYLEELAFFQAVKAVLTKADPRKALSDEAKEHAMRQIVSGALVSEEVLDIFEVAGLQKPDISILSDAFLDDVRHLEHRNLAVELLERLLNDEIRSRFRTNVVSKNKFSDLLEAALNRYKARAVETAQIIEELIAMAKEFRQAASRGAELGLDTDELAFYDALTRNEASVRELGDATLRLIAQELTKKLKASASVDWSRRDSVRAAMRVKVRHILTNHKYPPDMEAAAIDMVMKQAEVLSDEWATA
ncbi:type I restriction endonuclease subunit R [Variovorax sp. J22R133]|uniref:type I restriction endonuclease subunit R n=1 Tax=Variovorax brevis TaxID=3053503 RepID=UPI002574C9B0|nr:type I restriction endonuclease subunit R [Variovorax sp. J22R133]MDM0113949.1 type I restriction endonuclease subunit R [Variovorax sp. J22R133]